MKHTSVFGVPGSSPFIGAGFLAVWMDVPAEIDDEFNAWFTHEHMVERVGIPGFRRGRRFVSTESPDSQQRYFTFYETQSVEILRSEPYLDRLQEPTEWTRRIGPYLLNTDRAVWHVLDGRGRGQGGWVTTLTLPDREGLAKDISADILPKIAALSTVVAVTLARSNDDVTGAKEGTQEADTVHNTVTSDGQRLLLIVERTVEDAAAVLSLARGLDVIAKNYRLIASVDASQAR